MPLTYHSTLVRAKPRPLDLRMASPAGFSSSRTPPPALRRSGSSIDERRISGLQRDGALPVFNNTCRPRDFRSDEGGAARPPPLAPLGEKHLHRRVKFWTGFGTGGRV